MTTDEFVISLVAGTASVVLLSYVLRSQVNRLRLYSGRRVDDRYQVEFTVPLWVMAAIWLVLIVLSMLVDLDTFGQLMRTVLLVGPIGLFLGVSLLAGMTEWLRAKREALEA